MKKYTPKYFNQFSIKNISYYITTSDKFDNAEVLNFLFVVSAFFPICEYGGFKNFNIKSFHSITAHDVIIANKFLMKKIYIL